MRNRRLVMVIGLVALATAVLAVHFFGGDLMEALRAMHGPRR